VLVCQESGTRTCIHTPMSEDITTADVDAAFNSIYASTGLCLAEFDLAHFDSRHTEVSCLLYLLCLLCLLYLLCLL
jgi:hypothetical protein